MGRIGDGFSIAKVGDWRLAADILGNAAMNAARAFERATLAEAHFFERKLKEGIQSGAPGGKRYTPLSPLTLAMRKAAGFKGKKALIRSGAMLRSIHVVKRGGLYFVGIDRSAKTAEGDDLVEIAQLHEEGAGPFVVEMTPEARRYFFAMMKEAGVTPTPGASSGGGLQVAVIKIPARPTFGPVMEMWGKPEDVRARFEDRVARILYGLSPGHSGRSQRPPRPEDKPVGFFGGLFGGGGAAKKKGGGRPERDPSTGRFRKREPKA